MTAEKRPRATKQAPSKGTKPAPKKAPKKAAAPAKKTAAPAKKAVAPAKKAAEKKASPKAKKAVAPAEKKAVTPKKAVAPAAKASPKAKKAAAPAEKKAPKKAVAPAKKAVAPAEKKASPKAKAAPPPKAKKVAKKPAAAKVEKAPVDSAPTQVVEKTSPPAPERPVTPEPTAVAIPAPAPEQPVTPEPSAATAEPEEAEEAESPDATAEPEEAEEAESPDAEPIPHHRRVAPPSGVVAVIGRPNVGKSTLFNRLMGKKLAIVHDEPGVTRDRHYGEAESYGRRYTLIDTGGFDPTSDDPMRQGIKRQIQAALAEADVVVCVLDAREPATTVDHAEMDLLRAAQKPVLYVANKADSPRHEAEASDLYRLGIPHLIAVSALHGRGVDELETAIVHALPPPAPPSAEPEGEQPVAVAIIGRPNAGKSSLVNRLSGKERMLVDDKPGTTRDPIDTLIERDGKKLLLIDTAGIRRKAKVEKRDDAVEAMSVMAAVRTMERAEIVVLLCDAHEGVSEQDAKILGLAVDRGAAIVVGLNKTDLLDEKQKKKATEDTRDKLSFCPWAPIVHISAKTGRGVNVLFDAIARVGRNYRKRVTTGELNRFFEQVLANRAPPTSGGRAPRLFYVTQAETAPPLFVVIASDPASIHFSYRRYVVNQLRKAFDLEGVPVRVKYIERRRRKLKDGR